jgi:hypothetical protein
MSAALDGDKVSPLLQADIKARLDADDLFNDITVLTEEENDLASEVAIALGCATPKDGKMGACVIVQQPIGSDENPGLQFGPMRLDWTLLVLENGQLNRDADIGTLKAAWTIARRVQRVLKGYKPGGLAHPLMPQKPCIVPTKAVINRGDEEIALTAYEVRLWCLEGDHEAFTKVAPPSIAAVPGLTAGATVTLSCATVGAAIYYTTDFSHPSAENGTLYEAPFVVAAACVLRVAAFKAGSVGSDVTAAKFS